MPFIQTTTNVPIPAMKEQALKTRMGEAIQLLPGKSENWLMLTFRDQAPMYFKGDDAPCAICQVALYGSSTEAAYEALTAALTAILSEELALAPDRIYIAYAETSTWGWNGENF